MAQTSMMDAEFGAPATTEVTPEPAKVEAPKAETKPEQPRTVSPTSQDTSAAFMREIDLGDGSGKQVFKGDTAEELIDALTKAQENASRKIRELTKKEKTKPNLVVESPVKKDQPIEERVAAFEQAQFETSQANEFIARHAEDYLPTVKNGKRITQFLKAEGLQLSQDNLEYAFEELTESGLLEVTPAPKVVNDSTDPDEDQSDDERIVVPEHTRTKPKKLNTGLSAKNSPRIEAVESETDKREAEVAELYAMDPSKAREKILAMMHKAKAGTR